MVTRYFTIKNLDQFQHYKDRNPPWIKLWTKLLDDYEFNELSKETQRDLMMIWLFISKVPERRLAYDSVWIARKINSRKPVDLDAIAQAGFIVPSDEVAVIKSPWPSRYIPESLRSEVFARDEHQCVDSGTTQNLEIDHVIPVSKLPPEWKPTLEGLQTLCRSCNRPKRVNCVASAERLATQTSNAAEPYVSNTEHASVSVSAPDLDLRSFPDPDPDLIPLDPNCSLETGLVAGPAPNGDGNGHYPPLVRIPKPPRKEWDPEEAAFVAFLKKQSVFPFEFLDDAGFWEALSIQIDGLDDPFAEREFAAMEAKFRGGYPRPRSSKRGVCGFIQAWFKHAADRRRQEAKQEWNGAQKSKR